MYRSGAIGLLAVAAFVAAPAASQAATYLTVGASSLCGPAGCFAGAKKTYTQTFSSAERGGATFDVSQLQVFKSLTAGAMDHTAVKVTFVLADGTELTWGKFSLEALGGDVVTLAGQAVAWDTSLGDLTLRVDLVVPEKAGAGGGGGFGGGWAAGGGGAAVDGAGFTDIVQGAPLVRPSLPNPGVLAAVPEPGTWALMILGFGGAGAMLRRRTAYHLRYG